MNFFLKYVFSLYDRNQGRKILTTLLFKAILARKFSQMSENGKLILNSLNRDNPPAWVISHSASVVTVEKRVSRHSILSQINEAGYPDPDTLNEARQMASLVLSVIKYPHEFFKNKTLDEQFYATIGSLVSKMVTRITTSDADDYHLNNETMMSTVEDIVSVIGFAMKCTVIDRKRLKILKIWNDFFISWP